MSSATASSSKVESPAKVGEPHKEEEQPTLGVLEEDDEFEEFEVAGKRKPIVTNHFVLILLVFIQTGTIPRPILHIWEGQPPEQPNLVGTNCGRIIGTMMMSRTISVCN
jgi:hypothetical protein